MACLHAMPLRTHRRPVTTLRRERCIHGNPYRGIFTIPATPFDEDYQVDWPGLRSSVDFWCWRRPRHRSAVNAKWFSTLSDESASRMRVVVEQVAGRAPVLGVQASRRSMPPCSPAGGRRRRRHRHGPHIAKIGDIGNSWPTRYRCAPSGPSLSRTTRGHGHVQVVLSALCARSSTSIISRKRRCL